MATNRSASSSGLPREGAIAGLMGHVGLKLTFAATGFLELYRDRLAAIDLTPSRVLALSIVVGTPGLDQKSLADALSVNQASAMAAVNRLEASGYLRRDSGKDKRSKALFATDSGLSAFAEALEMERRLSDEILGGLTGTERVGLADMLDRIRKKSGELSGQG